MRPNCICVILQGQYFIWPHTSLCT